MRPFNDTLFWFLSLRFARRQNRIPGILFSHSPVPKRESGRHALGAPPCRGGSSLSTPAHYPAGGARCRRPVRGLAGPGILSALRSDEQGCREPTRVSSPGSVSGPCVPYTFSFSRRAQTGFRGGVTGSCSRQQRGRVLVALCPGRRLFGCPMGASGSSLHTEIPVQPKATPGPPSSGLLWERVCLPINGRPGSVLQRQLCRNGVGTWSNTSLTSLSVLIG